MTLVHGRGRLTAAGLLVASGAVVIAFATLRPGPAGMGTEGICLVCGPYGGVDAILNLLLFVPFGVGLALARTGGRTALGIVFGCSLAIELLQLQHITGRDATLGDLLWNTLGGAAGFLMGRHPTTLLRPPARLAAGLALASIIGWVSVQGIVAYSFVPALPPGPYYGQIGRPSTASRLAFPGRVHSARAGDVSLTPGRLASPERLRDLLSRRGGTRVEVAVTPGPPAAGRAEVLVVSGPDLAGVMSVEQLGRALLFGVRTGAERMRLRPYEFLIHDVFPADPHDVVPDTLTLFVHYSTREVRAGALGGRTGQEWLLRFVPRLSAGWILLAPAPTLIAGDGREALASAVYFAALLVPTGYWLVFACAGARRRAVLATALLLATLAAGLVAVPLAFDLAPAAGTEWAVAVAGLLAGVGLGTLMRSARKNADSGATVDALSRGAVFSSAPATK